MYVSTIRKTFLSKSIQFIPNPQIFLLPLPKRNNLLNFQTPQTFSMNLVSFNTSIRINSIKFDHMPSKLTLTRQGLKFIIETVLQIAVSHNMFNQSLIIFTKFRLIRIAVYQRFAQHYQLMLTYISTCPIFVSIFLDDTV